MKIENSREIEGLEPILSNRPNVSNSLKKHMKTQLDGLYTLVKAYLIWYSKLKTFDYFLYLPNHELWC